MEIELENSDKVKITEDPKIKRFRKTRKDKN